jgi:hypothetical protein
VPLTEEATTPPALSNGAAANTRADSLPIEHAEDWRHAVLRLVAAGIAIGHDHPYECAVYECAVGEVPEIVAMNSRRGNRLPAPMVEDTPRQVRNEQRLSELRRELSRCSFGGYRMICIHRSVADMVRSSLAGRVDETLGSMFTSGVLRVIAQRLVNNGTTSSARAERLAHEELAKLPDRALASGDYFRYEPPGIRVRVSDGGENDAGWEFGVMTTLHFDRGEVDALIANAPKRTPAARGLECFIPGCEHACLRASDAAVELRAKAIDPDEWPDLYWRSAMRLGRIRAANVFEAQLWKRELFSGRFETEHAIRPSRLPGRHPDIVELFMLEPAVTVVLDGARLSQTASRRGGARKNAELLWRADLRAIHDEFPSLSANEVEILLGKLPGYEVPRSGGVLPPGSSKPIASVTIAKRLSEMKTERKRRSR